MKSSIVGLLLTLFVLLTANCSSVDSLPPSSYLPEIPRISVEEVKSKLDDGFNLLIVDSRSGKSYNQYHIVGAISIPLSIMAEKYNELNGYDEIITYCQ
jgi:hypothetical protein